MITDESSWRSSRSSLTFQGVATEVPGREIGVPRGATCVPLEEKGILLSGWQVVGVMV